MIHVFLLMVYLGTGDDRRVVSNDMYFRSITECNFFAKETTKRYGNFSSYDWLDSKDRVTAYCLPKRVNENGTLNGVPINIY